MTSSQIRPTFARLLLFGYVLACWICVIRLLVVIFLAIGCSEPPEPEKETTTVPPAETLQKSDQISTMTSCAGSQWDSSRVKSYSCEMVDGRWKCLCDGVSYYSEIVECREALKATCEVGDEIFGGCQSQFGKCNPDGDDIRCQCNEGTETFLTDRVSCNLDLFVMCSTSCEQGNNSCVPISSIEDHYRCDCGVERSKSVGAPSCDAALDTACNRVACSGWSGYCQEVTDPEWSYDCQCVNGQVGSRTLTELGGADCDAALTDVCGDDVRDNCSNETDQGTWNCEAKPGSLEYECTCRIQCENDERIIVDTYAADSCEEILGTFCDPIALCLR